jgi:hypothetical protein
MTPLFEDLIIGGVMLAPILSCVAMTLVIALALQPILRRIGFTRLFASPAIAELSLYVSIFGLLTLLV